MSNTNRSRKNAAKRPALNDCSVCRQLRQEGPGTRIYAVAPADGGGWRLWSAALLRLFQRMSAQPTQAVIISQPGVHDRYAQAQIGHGIAHAEVSSNVYLMGSSRLSSEQEALLVELGWLPPRTLDDDPDEMPANWRLPLIHGDMQYLVEMFLAVMVGVLEFEERVVVEVRSFQVDNPCRACSWPAETLAHRHDQ